MECFFFQALFEHLPQQRKLSDDMKCKAGEFLSLKVNKKLLQQKLSSESGKKVTLKDISNIATKLANKDRNNIDNVVDLLQSKYGK